MKELVGKYITNVFVGGKNTAHIRFSHYNENGTIIEGHSTFAASAHPWWARIHCVVGLEKMFNGQVVSVEEHRVPIYNGIAIVYKLTIQSGAKQNVALVAIRSPVATKKLQISLAGSDTELPWKRLIEDYYEEYKNKKDYPQ